MQTRFTQKFHSRYPIVVAPMASVTGGKLAASVINSGGFGFIAGGYANDNFLSHQYSLALDLLRGTPHINKLGVGFITWKLTDHPESLASILSLQPPPAAVFLSFGNPAQFIPQIHNAGSQAWCQTHTLADVKHAADCGADVIIAQGGGGGGHGLQAQIARSTMTFVPEAADWLAQHHPEVLLLAAGGIADSRSIVAALALGADAVVMGTTFWLTQESLAPIEAKELSLSATGDATIQSSILDIIRGYSWPEEYLLRSLKYGLCKQWNDDYETFLENIDHIRQEYTAENLPENSMLVGEAIGTLVQHISTIPSAETVMKSLGAGLVSRIATLGEYAIDE